MLAVRTGERESRGWAGTTSGAVPSRSGRGRLIPHLRDAGHWSLGGGGTRSEGSRPGFRPDHPGEPGGVTTITSGQNEQGLDPLLKSPVIVCISGLTLRPRLQGRDLTSGCL